ncbi:hypothetical protein F0726_01343 [Acidithiobacillus caldus]|nr:hypothetical protein F0726_01343 [Acidithiobacillus caldus]
MLDSALRGPFAGPLALGFTHALNAVWPSLSVPRVAE